MLRAGRVPDSNGHRTQPCVQGMRLAAGTRTWMSKRQTLRRRTRGQQGTRDVPRQPGSFARSSTSGFEERHRELCSNQSPNNLP